MRDRLVASLITVPITIIILLLMIVVLLSLGDQEPSNPIGSIPKVIFDHTEDGTVITVMAVGERRYDAIHINYTVGDETHPVNATRRYSLDTNVSALSFTLNVTVDLGDDHYILNCTVVVDVTTSGDTYLWIQEEDDSKATRHRSPYTILAEWRDMK
jgi:hypothetical protein